MDPDVTVMGTVVVTAAEELVKVGIERYIKPLLSKKYGKEEEQDLIETVLLEYLSINYDYHNKMNTIVFRDRAVSLEELYFPLKIYSLDHSKKDEIYMIDGYNKNLFEAYNKLLIVDTAGMGKSTIVKYMAVSMIKENCGIPLLIELRKIKKGSILDYIVEQFNFLNQEIPEKDIIDLIRKGEFTIFFDGFDEIVKEDRQNVVDAMEEFMKKCNNNIYVITSREEEDLLCFGDFSKFRIKNLEMNEAFELIRKYDSVGKYNKADELIYDIKNNHNLDVLKDFLNNPLLVSLLYKTFLYKGEIQYKKMSFYRQVYEALFNDHDKTKGGSFVHEKRTNLDIDEFDSVMCVLGFKSLQMNQVSFDKNEIESYIKDALKMLPSHIKVTSSDVLYDILHSVPFFQEEGIELKWVHKSFMEFFAARFICYEQKEFQEQIIYNMLKQDNVFRFFNVMSFISEMDMKLFSKTVILYILKEYIKYYNSIEEPVDSFTKNEIKIRKEIICIFDKIKLVGENVDGLEGMGGGILLRDGVIEFTYRNKLVYLLDLLKNRNIDIFKSYINTKSRKTEISIKKNAGKVCCIDNIFEKNDDNEWQNDIFKKLINHRLVLDYDKCIKLKDEIENSIKTVDASNFAF